MCLYYSRRIKKLYLRMIFHNMSGCGACISRKTTVFQKYSYIRSGTHYGSRATVKIDVRILA